MAESFDDKVGELVETVNRAFPDGTLDDRQLLLRDLLLAQVKVCAIHYKLMLIESEGRFHFDISAFSEIIEKHLEVSRFFKGIPRSAKHSTYEMKSIFSFYNFVASHFDEGVSKD